MFLFHGLCLFSSCVVDWVYGQICFPSAGLEESTSIRLHWLQYCISYISALSRDAMVIRPCYVASNKLPRYLQLPDILQILRGISVLPYFTRPQVIPTESRNTHPISPESRQEGTPRSGNCKLSLRRRGIVPRPSPSPSRNYGGCPEVARVVCR